MHALLYCLVIKFYYVHCRNIEVSILFSLAVNLCISLIYVVLSRQHNVKYYGHIYYTWHKHAASYVIRYDCGFPIKRLHLGRLSSSI